MEIDCKSVPLVYTDNHDDENLTLIFFGVEWGCHKGISKHPKRFFKTRRHFDRNASAFLKTSSPFVNQTKGDIESCLERNQANSTNKCNESIGLKCLFKGRIQLANAIES